MFISIFDLMLHRFSKNFELAKADLIFRLSHAVCKTNKKILCHFVESSFVPNGRIATKRWENDHKSKLISIHFRPAYFLFHYACLKTSFLFYSSGLLERSSVSSPALLSAYYVDYDAKIISKSGSGSIDWCQCQAQWENPEILLIQGRLLI